jgi:hypothetical protein
MNTFKTILLGASLLTAAANVQAGELVLDSFNYNPQLDLEANSSSTVVTGQTVSAETGANAFYTLNYLSGLSDDTVKSFLAGDGLLSYSEDSLTNGSISIEYFFDLDSNGLYDPIADFVTLDFSIYQAFKFDVLVADDGFEIELVLTDSAGNTSVGNLNTGAEITSLTSLSMSFSGFTVDAGFDYSSVGNILANITSDGDADDFTLSQVSLVPEPSAVALLGLGLIGLGLRRRKLV